MAYTISLAPRAAGRQKSPPLHRGPRDKPLLRARGARNTIPRASMDSISSRIQEVSPSLTLAVTNQAKAMLARGEEVYGLAGGEPEVDTPEHIKAAAIVAMQ